MLTNAIPPSQRRLASSSYLDFELPRVGYRLRNWWKDVTGTSVNAGNCVWYEWWRCWQPTPVHLFSYCPQISRLPMKATALKPVFFTLNPVCVCVKREMLAHKSPPLSLRFFFIFFLLWENNYLSFLWHDDQLLLIIQSNVLVYRGKSKGRRQVVTWVNLNYIII